MRYVKQAWQWIVQSSANPQATSLSVKMALLGIVPYALNIATAACGFGLVCLGVDAVGFNDVVEAISDTVFSGLTIVSSLGFIYGFGRKIVLSVKGRNQVVAGWREH